MRAHEATMLDGLQHVCNGSGRAEDGRSSFVDKFRLRHLGFLSLQADL